MKKNMRMAMEEEEEGEGGGAARVATVHIKKRALRNNALAISFNDKDLRDYVTGFHKRKKKRRKEGQRQLQEKERLKRIEQRKKRKLEKELALYGGALPQENPPDNGDEFGGEVGADDDFEPNASVSGTKTYDNGDATITVTTSELSHEDKDLNVTRLIPKLVGEEKKQPNLSVKKKPFKRVLKSRKKPKKSGSQKKGKKSRNKR